MTTDELNVIYDRNRSQGQIKSQPWLHINCCTPVDTEPPDSQPDQSIMIDYVYRGSCTNIVDGCEVKLDAGDLILLRPGTTRRVSTKEQNSTIVSIFLLPKDAYKLLDGTIRNNPISEFLLSASLNTSGQPGYIKFQTGENQQIQDALDNLMREYFVNDPITAEVLAACYLRETFALLWKENVLRPDRTSVSSRFNNLVNDIVNYIRENCVTCTRTTVANHFGYSGSRISSLLREHLDRGFIDLRDEFRLELADKLLSNTDLAVREIAERCGYSNMSRFYKVYREQYNCMPRGRQPSEARENEAFNITV